MSELKVALLPVTPFAQNCTLFWCDATRKTAVIDPGGEVDRILRAVAEEGLELDKILITHAHVDHAGGAAALAEKTGAPIIGPQRQDQFWIDMIEDAGREYGFAGVRAFSPSRWLEQGDQVKLGELTLDVLHCPGHTPGHVVYYHAPSRLAQVGDVLFQGSIGRTDFPRGNHADLIRSIKQRLFPLGDDVTFIPGHGPAGTLGEERRTNPFLQGQP